MPKYEYKVVPAPNRGQKAKGVKRAEDRFALTLTTLMNAFGAEGWDYVRSDILPAEERSGLASKQVVYHTMLVFRRVLAEMDDTADQPAQDTPLALAAPEAEEEPVGDAEDAPQDGEPEDSAEGEEQDPKAQREALTE